MDKKLLREYAALEIEYKEIEARRSNLRDAIVQRMVKDKLDKVESDFGMFTVGRRASWTYTDAVKKIEDRLKIAKTKEQQKGLAKSSETEYLVYKPITA